MMIGEEDAYEHSIVRGLITDGRVDFEFDEWEGYKVISVMWKKNARAH